MHHGHITPSLAKGLTELRTRIAAANIEWKPKARRVITRTLPLSPSVRPSFSPEAMYADGGEVGVFP